MAIALFLVIDMPECEHCRYHRVWRDTEAEGGYLHSCQHMRSVSFRIVGTVVTCKQARSEIYPCGPHGTLWEKQSDAQ